MMGRLSCRHYNDVIMGEIASQITSLMIVYSTVYSDADQRKNQSSVSLAFVRGIHRGPVNSPHKWPVTRKIFQFDDVIMEFSTCNNHLCRNQVIVQCQQLSHCSNNDILIGTAVVMFKLRQGPYVKETQVKCHFHQCVYLLTFRW